MKNLTRPSFIYLFILIGVVFPNQISAQWYKLADFKNKISIDIDDKNIILKPEDTTIAIPYKIKADKRRLYNVRLFYSNNKGNSFKGPQRSVVGDVGDSLKITSGTRNIKWAFRKDNPYFDGKDIMFKIEAVEVPKIATGGSKYALYSLLMPGLGDAKVRNGYNYGWITALSYGSLITGGVFQLQAINRYNDYTNRIANSPDDHDALYRKAQNSQNLAYTFFGIGAGVWVADIVGVYFRGLKNKKRIAREKARLEAEKGGTQTSIHPLLRPTKYQFDWTPTILPQYSSTQNQLTFLWKF